MSTPDHVEPRTLWTLRKDLRLAEVRVCVTVDEAQVLTYVGGTLHGVLRLPVSDADLLESTAANHRDELVLSGWQVVSTSEPTTES